MPRKIEHKWFRLWAPEVLGEADPDGFNAYKEFGPQEHWCWLALRALCASTEFQPAICVTPFVGYTDKQFADLFKVDVRVWQVVKEKLEVAGRIEVDIQNVIRLTGWERYGGLFFQGRKKKDAEMRLWTVEDDEKERQRKKEWAEIFKRVILHLDQESGKKFKVGSPESFRHFTARMREGATEEQFIHVVDVKCAQWRGREDMEPYIRPQTLFNSRTFWDYVAEPPIKKKRPIGGAGSLSILPEETAKYEAEAKKEYDERIHAAIERYGWKSEDEIPAKAYADGIPTFTEFFKMFIKKKRESKEWSLE